ncbi:MAG: NAD-dependent epimerase/dehydratase family protein [Kofleriaceae bacterium]
MKIFVGGATGFIGEAIVKVLRARGHEVLGSARNADAAAKVKALGATPVTADLADAATFGAAAKQADAVIQAASTSDQHSPDYEPKVARAILDAIKGTQKPFILTSGVWVYGATKGATEATPTNPIPLVAWRIPGEQEVLAAGGIVIRPAIVHGHGKGIPAMMVGAAKKDKRVTVIGDGTNKWPTVHTDDLAELYALLIEKGERGTIYNGTSGEHETVEQLGKLVAKRFNADYGTWPVAEAAKVMGPFADALALDQTITSPRSMALGWKPKAPKLSDELASGSYG